MTHPKAAYNAGSWKSCRDGVPGIDIIRRAGLPPAYEEWTPMDLPRLTLTSFRVPYTGRLAECYT